MSLSPPVWTLARTMAPAGFRAQWRAWRVERRRRNALRNTFRLLLHVDDLILADIGLDRAFVDKAARLPLSVDAGTVLRVPGRGTWLPSCALTPQRHER